MLPSGMTSPEIRSLFVRIMPRNRASEQCKLG